VATVIDALIVTLGLDPANFTQGQKEAVKSLKKTEDEAARTAKELEARGKQAAQFFSQIKNQAIALFAAFTAGEGVKSFVQNMVEGDAAVGRLAKNVGMTVDALSAWQGVADRAGGSAAGMAGSIKNLSGQMQKLALTGTSDIIPFLTAAHVNLSQFFDATTPMAEKLLLISDALQGMDPAKAQALGAGMGLDEGTINVLMQGRAAVMALLAEQEKLGHANAASAESSMKLKSAWSALGQSSANLGRNLLSSAAPGIQAVSDGLIALSEWAAQHQDAVKGMIAGLGIAVGAFTALALAPMIAAAAAAVAAAAPVILVIAAVAAGVALVIANLDEIKQALGPVLTLFSDIFNDIIGVVKSAARLIYALMFGTGDDIRTAWHSLTGDMGKYFTDFVKLIKNIGPAIFDALTEAFGAAFNWITGRAAAVWDAITGKKSAAVGTRSASGEVRPSSGSPAMAAGSVKSAQEDIAQLMKLGWTKEQATGIAANIQRESGGRADAVGDNGQAYGLAQWHPDRQANFERFAGKNIRQSSHEEQVAFIDYELRKGSEQNAGRALSSARTAAEAAAIVASKYERPADVAGESQKRAEMAQAMTGGARPDPSLQTGAVAKVSSSSVSNTAATTNTSEVHVGQITVQTQATDAKGIARAIGGEIRAQSLADQANRGLS
jgi:hypothetical protein